MCTCVRVCVCVCVCVCVHVCVCVQCVDVHLKFMAFLLQDGALYIPTKRAFDIWDTLIANPTACDMDRRVSGVS